MLSPKHVCGALTKNPDLAREIGFLVADYAAIEFTFFHIFAILSPDHPEDTFSTFFSQRSINRKVELILNEAWRVSPEPYSRAIERLARRMKGAARRRTEIAHVHFMQGSSGPMRLQLYGGEAKLALLEDQFIQRTIHQFHTLAVDVLNYVGLLVAVAPDVLVAKLNRVHGPINEQLQRPPPVPQDQLDTLGEDGQNESDRRLGIYGAARPIVLELWWPLQEQPASLK